MQKQKKDNQFLKKAYYEGGNTAFRAFVAKNLKYPKEALKNNVEGLVHLRIEINHKGKVTSAKVVSGIGHGCDEEAIRIIKLAEYVVPKVPRKLRVKFNKNVRIQFKKPPVKKVKKASKTSIKYNITPTKKPEKEAPKAPKKENSYSYTIRF